MSILLNALLKLRGAQNWPKAEADVYSCKWEDHPGSDSPGGIITIIYSYHVSGELQAGKVSWSDERGVDIYHRGDRIMIRYDPRSPRRSYFPERQDLQAGLLFTTFLAIGVLVLLILSITLLR